MKMFLAVLALGLSPTSFAGYYSCHGRFDEYETCLTQHYQLTVDTSALAYQLTISNRLVRAPSCDVSTRRPSTSTEGTLVSAIGGFNLAVDSGPLHLAYLEMDNDVPNYLMFRDRGAGSFSQRIPLNCTEQEGL